MSRSEREGLLARVRQLRRPVAAPRAAAGSPAAEVAGSDLRALESRIAHLEQLLQGLQDSVHRESSRQGKQIAELEARLQPAAMQQALDRDARERGL